MENETSLSGFVRTLAGEGRAGVAAHTRLGPAPGDPTVVAALAELAARARLELAGEAPALCAPAAGWAACLLHEACRFTVCRDLGEETMWACLGIPCPAPRGPETDWSVDLMFRHLPDVLRFARQLSNGDPLVVRLGQLAADWPLSSVGVPAVSCGSLDSFIAHPALRRLYADRILAQADFSRLGDPRVDDLLRADIGLHRDLAPLLAARLWPEPVSVPPPS
ncbi:MAG: hypothetical protein FD161_2236 [Limisphaerales bacterium]|nr:MAG: hypothetical protein FD161_2236 [Limisphaerales bacterium]KAG0508748.1 MAG: hypothetical protein E1N63_2038 [Limisphaerales bacterium]TXT50561.1 MAG: hypothetical protein FD140_2345 [Limisphaerales bacterium]